MDFFGKQITVCKVPCLQIIPSLELVDQFRYIFSFSTKYPFFAYERKRSEIVYYTIERKSKTIVGRIEKNGCLDIFRRHPCGLYYPALMPLDKDGSFLDTLASDGSRQQFGVFQYDGLIYGDLGCAPMKEPEIGYRWEKEDFIIRDVPVKNNGIERCKGLRWKAVSGYLIPCHPLGMLRLEDLFYQGLLPCYGMVEAETRIPLP